jgi:nitrate reductase alpha subunit
MKDYATFLRAAAKVTGRVRFLAIGGGNDDYGAQMRALAEDLGLSSRLIWSAPRSDMPTVFNALDVLVSSSAFGEGFTNYRPPVDLKATKGIQNIRSNGHKEIALNFITPHQKWGIHSTYSDNLMMLTLNRGGTVIWLSEDDAKSVGIEDNDWVELFNVNGAIAARAVVSQRVKNGMVMMYHSQEKIINTPGSEITGMRGGIHNSVTRIVLKPTHMIGGYAQFSYGFNYYGTIGTNRDEFVVVRKMSKVDWLEEEAQFNARAPVHA